jgi:hypothetical protein
MPFPLAKTHGCEGVIQMLRGIIRDVSLTQSDRLGITGKVALALGPQHSTLLCAYQVSKNIAAEN